MSGVRAALAAVGLLLPVVAYAEEPETEPETEDGEAPEAETEEADEAAPADDAEAPEAEEEAPPPTSHGGTMRRRRGIAALVGVESVSDDFGNHLSATMGGLDVRLGTQINDTVGVYVPLHLSFGAFPGLGTVAGVPAGLTGTAAATVVVDATFLDRFFLGGGGGIGVLNNPIGPALHVRFGGYPLVSHVAGTDRRRGLSVTGDLRMIYASGITATYPTLTVGYESF